MSPQPVMTRRQWLRYSPPALAGASSALLAACASDSAVPMPADVLPERLDTLPAVQWPRSHHMDVRFRGRHWRLMVLLPAQQAPRTALITLDGNATFGLAGQLLLNQSLSPEGHSRPVPLLISVGYPIDAAYDMAERTTDYTPSADPSLRYAAVPGGGADTLLDFFDTIVHPWLQRTQGIDPARCTLAGHSFGGLLGLYSLFTRPALFGQVVAISPSIWWDDRALLPWRDRFVQRQRQVAASAPPAPLRLEVLAGSLEENTPRPHGPTATREAVTRWQRQQVRAQISSAQAVVASLQGVPGLSAHMDTVAGANHGSVVLPGLSRAVDIAMALAAEQKATP